MTQASAGRRGGVLVGAAHGDHDAGTALGHHPHGLVEATDVLGHRCGEDDRVGPVGLHGRIPGVQGEVRPQPRHAQASAARGDTCESCGLSCAGGRGPAGFLAQPRRLTDPRFLRTLTEVPRFHRAARRVLDDGDSAMTWGEFLADGGYSEHFVRHFAAPLVSCVWSANEHAALEYPARHLFRFLDHHGMLSVKGSPTWRTVVGGSRAYVDLLTARLDDVRTGAAVTAVRRVADADQALEILADATPEEKQNLVAIGYSANHTVLHRDASVLPPTRARASWNHTTSCGPARRSDGVAVSYWMNRLQGLDTADKFVVTLNGSDRIAADAIVAEMDYTHPIFTPAAVRAAERLRWAGGERLAFAGAHLGWGFHEDGCRSGVEAAARLGVTW